MIFFCVYTAFGRTTCETGREGGREGVREGEREGGSTVKIPWLPYPESYLSSIFAPSTPGPEECIEHPRNVVGSVIRVNESPLVP